MRFKILAALAILAGAALFPLPALCDPKPALNEFEVQVQAFAPDAYGRLAGQISIRRANALPFETSYDTSFFATEFPPDQNGFMRVNARLGDGNLYAATIIQSEPGELPGMPMMHAHANLLGAGPPPPSPPAAITDLAATSNEDNQSTLTWSAVAGADSYDVYMSQLALPFSLANGGAGEDASSPFVVLYLSNGLEASFKVIARGPGGSSESNVATGTPADVVAPSAPAAPALTAADTEIEVAFPALSGDIVGYRVYTSLDDMSYAEDTSTPQTGSWTIEGLTNGVLVYVKISAEDEAANESALSAASSETPADTTAPDAPAAPSLTPGDTEIEVTLPSLTGDVAGFRVYYSETEVGGYAESTSSLATGSHTITGLTNSTLYYVRIAAEDEAENLSAQSDASSATPESSYDPAEVAGAEFFADFTLAAHVTADTGRTDAILNQVASDTWGDLAGVPGTDGGVGPEWTEGQGVQIGNHATTGYLTFGSRLTGMDDFTMVAAAEISTLGILAGVPSSPVSRVSIAGTVLTALADDDSETATVSSSGTHVWSIVKAGRSLTIYEDGARVYSGLFAASQPFALERLGQTSGVASTTQDLLYKALWAGAVALEGADRRGIEADLAARFGVTLAAEAMDNAVSGAVERHNLADAGSVTLNETPDPDRIASVASQWGTGRTLARATEANQPDAVGGAYFPSPGDARSLNYSPDVLVGDSFTIYMVLTFDSGGGGDVLSERTGTDYRFGIESDGDAKISIANASGTIAAGLSTAAGTRIIVFKKAAGVVSIYEDGTLLATDSSTWSATAAFEGEQVGFQSTFDGHVATLGLAVADLLFFSTAHSDAERAIVEAQLATDHGL